MSKCIVGRFPPPIGGVSVYVERRYKELKNDSGGVTCIDLGRRFALARLLASKSDSYEVNSLNIWLVLAFYFFFKIRKAVFIDHNASRHYTGFRKKLLLFCLGSAKGVYVVNKELMKFYDNSISLSIICPFVPPDQSEECHIWRSYPDGLAEFAQKDKVLLNSAWQYVPFEASDLYGVGTSIDLVARGDYHLILFIGDLKSVPLGVQGKMAQLIEDGKLFLVTGQKSMWPLFRHKPLFLRLTPTDGDSVSVREALFFDCPVVASDSVDRPQGCMLYRYGDNSQLSRTISEFFNEEYSARS